MSLPTAQFKESRCIIVRLSSTLAPPGGYNRNNRGKLFENKNKGGRKPGEKRVQNRRQDQGPPQPRLVNQRWRKWQAPNPWNPLNKGTDWPSVWPTPQSWNSSLIPLPILMGRHHQNREVTIPRNPRGNIELLKITNFLHLTPPAIERHVKGLKDYCTKYPDDVKDRPIRITYCNYVFDGPSLRHPQSRIVKLQVYLRDLVLNKRAKQKMIKLAGPRYNKENEELTLLIDSCPTRKQNKEYAYYLLTTLYREAWKNEAWESLPEGVSEREVKDEIMKVRKQLNPKMRKRFLWDKKRPNSETKVYRMLGDHVVQFNNVGHPFIVPWSKKNIRGMVPQDLLPEAKKQWKQFNPVTGVDNGQDFDPIKFETVSPTDGTPRN